MKNKTKFDVIRPLIDEAFDKGESFVFSPNGVSMLPFIKGGSDTVTIEKYMGNAKKYDIIFYTRENGQYVLHRVVKIKNGRLYACGDNLWWVEEVPEERIFARLKDVEGKRMHSVWYFIYCRTLFIRRFVIHVRNYLKKHIIKGEGK